QRRPAGAVVEALDGVRLAVPARIVVRPARSRLLGRVAIRRVREDVAGVVGDNVEDDVDPMRMGGPDEVAELFSGSEMRIDVEEVLDAVAVVGRLERDLPENGADPQGSDAEPLEIAELAFQSFQRSTLPGVTDAEPRVVINPARILRRVNRRR